MNYKDEQKMYRFRAKPRRVPEDEWDDHDREFMSKGTLYNRRHTRRKLRDPRFTKKRGFGGHEKNPAAVPKFQPGTNHERHLERQHNRGSNR